MLPDCTASSWQHYDRDNDLSRASWPLSPFFDLDLLELRLLNWLVDPIVNFAASTLFLFFFFAEASLFLLER